LVGHWPLDSAHYNPSTDRVSDISGYANHGTNYGATLTTDRYGQINGAMEFNGTNTFRTDQLFTDELNQEWTVTGWIYLD